VSNPGEFASLPVDVVEATVRWFDQQGDRVGAGVLVRELKARTQQSTPSRQRQGEYGRQLTAWLQRHFPDLCDEKGFPHPAAFEAVIHLHHRHGRGSLTAAEHGTVIRARVDAWNARYAENEPVAA
jgi:hypothetical protein